MHDVVTTVYTNGQVSRAWLCYNQDTAKSAVTVTVTIVVDPCNSYVSNGRWGHITQPLML